MTLLPAGSDLIRTEAGQGIEVSRDPLPEAGQLHPERVHLYGIGLGDSKRVRLQAAQAGKLIIDDEPDVAFDIVYLYRDWIAVRTEINLAAYTLYHFQQPRPSISETCRLTFQREAS